MWKKKQLINVEENWMKNREKKKFIQRAAVDLFILNPKKKKMNIMWFSTDFLLCILV